MVRLTRSDYRLIVVALVVAVASLWVTSRYFHRAFPEATVDFQVNSGGSATLAAQFLASRGLATTGYIHASQFGYDDQAKTFLERELGLPRTEVLLGTRVRLWNWENRWFRPLQPEEYRVDVTTTGAVDGFDHIIAEDAPGASLSEADARARAAAFLASVMRVDPATLIAVGAEKQLRPHRADYVFTWKDAAPLITNASAVAMQAEYRREVRVQGDEVAAYHEYVKVPDQWSRDYARLRSRNETAGEVDTALLLVLALGMLFVLVGRIRRGDVRWKIALHIGGLGAILSFLAALNSFSRFDYDTTSSYSAFVSNSIFGAIAGAVGIGVLLLVLTAAAEALYRERFPEKVALDKMFSGRGLRSKSFFISLVLGLALAAFFFAYQTIFYIIANHLGAWAPVDVPYDDLLNTRLPWAFVLFGGFFPAISEEFGFRMLAIPLFEKWFKYLWVAILAASFLWGFGHATYPNQPFYIRGLEVGLGGILLSWVMVRYGILTTVVWHYTVDAVYTAMLLLRAHDAYLRWSGALTAFLAVVPLLLALLFYWRRGGFLDAAPILNAAETAPPPPADDPAVAAVPLAPPPEPELVHTPYVPISGQSWTTGLLVAAVLLSAFAVRLTHWDTALPWQTSKSHAIAAARQFLQAQGYDLSGDRVAAETALPTDVNQENAIAATDIFSARGRRDLIAAFTGPDPTVVAEYWRIRFFRPGREEEFSVGVRPDTGKVISFVHQLPETAAGAALPLDAARATATAFLAAQGLDVAAMAVKSAVREQRTARADSTFVWERATPVTAPLVPGVAYRIKATVIGDRVGYYHSWYHVPEARVRAFNQTTLLDTLLSVLRGLLYAAAAALVLGYFLVFVRRRQLAWGTLLRLGIAAGLLLFLITLNALPSDFSGYSTAQPWPQFLAGLGISLGVAALGGFLLTVALLAPLAITAPHTTELTRANARRQLERETAWDALWVGVLGLGWILGWTRVQSVIASRWHDAGQPPLPSPPAGLAHYIPGLGDWLSAPLHALWIAAFLGILLPAFDQWWNRPRHRIVVIAGVALLWIGTIPVAHTLYQFGQAALFSALSLALLFGFAHLFLRNNPFAYLSAALLPALVSPGFLWLSLPTPEGHTIGALLIATAVAWLFWLGIVSRKPRPA